ncbi:MAG: RloB family protein [Defluviitaleaceae bacterium]|nr:RloB family protein [Defluviitaleaceae bacterium]
MGSENLFHKKRAGRKKREEEIREQRKTQWLIVCEGFTEQHYFKGFVDSLNIAGDSNIDIRTVGEGSNTKRLINNVEKYFDFVDIEYGKQRIPYENEKMIFVFDKDDFPANNFNTAINIATTRYPGCTVAWSNESFELWLCLHFEYIQSSLRRNEYNDKLTKIFRKNGIFTKRQDFDSNGKNDPQLYEKIKQCNGDIDNAIKWARALKASKTTNNPAKANPATMVFEAVDALINDLS